jgi:hypothetical protein
LDFADDFPHKTFFHQFIGEHGIQRHGQTVVGQAKVFRLRG